jgi:hypothetical protein
MQQHSLHLHCAHCAQATAQRVRREALLERDVAVAQVKAQVGEGAGRCQRDSMRAEGP